MQNIYWSIILLGHGIKPFGYALIDELFPFFLKIQKIKFVDNLHLLILFLSVLIFISSLCSILIDLSDYLYKIHLLWIGICIFFLTQVNFNYFENKYLIFSSFLYLFLNLVFVIMQQFNFLLSGGFLKCNSLVNECFLDYVFWQDFWAGTAYSALGLFLSAILLLSVCKKLASVVSVISTLSIVIFFQETKTGLIFLLLIFLFFLRKKPMKYLFLMLLILTLVIFLEIILSFLGNNVLGGYTYSFKYIFDRTTLGYLLTSFFNILDFNNYSGILDTGRVDQIKGIISYSYSVNFSQLFFGNFTGAHRFGLDQFIPRDNSGILRPIGIVAWIYDWGLIFISSYLIIFIVNLRRLIFELIKKGENFYTHFILLLIYLFISLNPMITNVNDSILFWVVFFYPNLVLVKILKINNI